MSFIAELKRRNVFKVGAAYVVVAWLIAQGVDVFLENFGAPEWVIKTVLLLLVAGLPLALLFAWAFELTPEGIKKEKDVDRSQSITQETGRKLDFVIIGVLLVALGWFAWDKFAPSAPSGSENHLQEVAEGSLQAPAANGSLTPDSSAATGMSAKSIAVLPFVNMSSDPEQEYFSDGISEEILNALAKVKDLQVSGRTSSFAFKGQNQDLREIGETLGVNHVLEGSVRKSGNTVRITAQLIRVDNGFHLWSETYDREMDNVFAIQDEIANAILHELKATLLVGDDTAPKVARTNSEAYDLYLLAKQRIYERTRPSMAAAAELLDRAIASDPEYAPAYAQRGIVALLQRQGAGTYGDLPAQQSQTTARLYLDKALQLDPQSAEAMAGMGLYYRYVPGGLEQSIEYLRKALAINPGMIDASNWLGNTLNAAGRPAEYRKLVEEIMQRDPLYRPGIGNIIVSLAGFGETDKALSYLERIRKQIPDRSVIDSYEAYVRLFRGEIAAAMQLSEASLEQNPDDAWAQWTKSQSALLLGEYEKSIAVDEPVNKMYALMYLGRTEEADQVARDLADKHGDVESFFSYLNMRNRSPEVIAYLEERWPGLDELEKDFPPYGTNGYWLMLEVATAYSRAGNESRFNDAMQRINTTQESLLAQGVINQTLYLAEACRLALAGDPDSSLDFVERSINSGLISADSLASDYPALNSLAGDPRFESLQAQIKQRADEERAKLGLEPLST